MQNGRGLHLKHFTFGNVVKIKSYAIDFYSPSIKTTPTSVTTTTAMKLNASHSSSHKKIKLALLFSNLYFNTLQSIISKGIYLPHRKRCFLQVLKIKLNSLMSFSTSQNLPKP